MSRWTRLAPLFAALVLACSAAEERLERHLVRAVAYEDSGQTETALIARGLAILDERPTHHLMNRELGALKFLNRLPELIYRIDLALLTTKLLEGDGGNRLVLARRPIVGETFRP